MTLLWGVIWLSATRFRRRYFLCFGGADRMAFASSSGMVGMDCWILRMSFVTGRPRRYRFLNLVTGLRGFVYAHGVNRL